MGGMLRQTQPPALSKMENSYGNSNRYESVYGAVVMVEPSIAIVYQFFL